MAAGLARAGSCQYAFGGFRVTKSVGKAVATLRHIATLGLPAGMVFEQVTECLSEIFPFESASMVLYDHDLQATDALLTHEISPAVSNRYFERWFNQEEARFIPSHRRAALGQTPDVFNVGDYAPRLWETELYDEVFRDLGFYRMSSMTLRQGGRAAGNICFGRTEGGLDFSTADLKAMSEVAGYASLALAATPAEEGIFENQAMDQVETALVVTNGAGEVEHLTYNGWRLLRWASLAHFNTAVVQECLKQPAAHYDAYGWARPLLSELSRRVMAASEGRPAPPAVIRRRSRHGEFVLTAFLMHGGAAQPDPPMIIVQIQRLTPMEVRLFASPLFRGLSAQEQIVARLLLKGVSQPDIARQIGVSPHTVVSHVRNIYRRTGASDRETLRAALLPPPEADLALTG
jgi:DNA-binding CsgD family transcriptional regulator